MPQEISLVQEFTGIGALYYFGRINGIEDKTIEERYAFLSELLQLPPKNRLVKEMSGGQQRRISLACALLHEPELLILDEPTVGLDPVLRENIWDFLVSITTQRGVTIVITTHYIEETKLADKIGLLRHGKLLAEASPKRLLAKCRCDSLEEAFLRLSQKQEVNEESLRRSTTENNVEYLPELEEITNIRIPEQNYTLPTKSYDPNASWVNSPIHRTTKRRKSRRFQALMIKNFYQFVRNPGGILFAFIFPILQINAFFNAIGDDPKDLTMAVINHEAGNCQAGNYLGQVLYKPDEFCDFIDLSCRFLDDFNKNVMRNKFYNDSIEAINAVRHGNADGVMIFPKNFSIALQERLENFEVDDVASGEIGINLDMGNRQIGLYLEKNLYKQFFDTYRNILQECALPKNLGDFPMRLEEPIFGKLDESYSTFMAPGFILTLTFFLATSVSSSIIIADRHEGVWHRSLVQGVTTAEILTSHILTQMVVIVIQVAVTSIGAFVQYNLECRGSLIAIILLIYFNSICGMCYGFLVSVMCTSHTVANFIATGSFYPVILLCGCVWPIEGMPKVLQWLSLAMPTTMPAIAMRNILVKGYNFGEPQVYSGFLIIAGWTIALAFLCFIGLMKKKS